MYEHANALNCQRLGCLLQMGKLARLHVPAYFCRMCLEVSNIPHDQTRIQ